MIKALKKKIVNLFLVCLLGVLTIAFFPTKTYALLTTEFFTGGMNCLDPDNVVFIPGNDVCHGKIKTIRPFRVYNNTEYYFYTHKVESLFFGDAIVKEYSQDGQEIGALELTRYNSANYVSLSTTTNTYYIGFDIDVYCSSVAKNELSDPSTYIFTNSDNTTSDLDYDIAQGGRIDYNGPYLEKLRVIESTLSIETNISDPISNQEIADAILVYDLYDGIISDQKRVLSSSYDYTSNQVGSFSIVYEVTNSVGVSNQLEVNIDVLDDIKPVISGANTYTMYSTNLKTISDIKKELIASDNVDGDLTDDIFIKEDNFSNRTTKLGTWDIVFSVTDKANNETLHTVSVTVLEGDLVGPVFGGKTQFTTTTEEVLTIEEMLSEITVIDDYDGDVKSEVEVVRNEYIYNTNKRGIYYIDLRVSDSAGNVTTHTIEVLVIDMSAPVFLLNTVVIYLPLNSNINTTDDLIVYLQKTNYLSTDSIVNVKYENYLENKNTLGEYQLILESDNNILNVCVSVCEDVQILNTSLNKEKTGFFAQIKQGLKNMGSRIKSFFRRLFERVF